MESKKDNIKALFSNSRTRIIIIFTFSILLTAVLLGYFRFKGEVAATLPAETTLGGTPNIQSIPGAVNQTVQYAKLQTEENIVHAEDAIKQGGSAIPTLVQMQKIGEGVEPILDKGSLGFVALQQLGDQGMGPWFDALKSANCSVESLNKALSQGAGLSDLRQACDCKALKEAGYPLKTLTPVCSCPDLRGAGFKATELKTLGYDAIRLKNCGFNACELKAAGFSAQELLEAGFSADELKGAGFPEKELLSDATLPAGVALADVRQAGCNVAALIKLREKGVSAASIRRMSGCSAAQLKAAGYSAAELRAAGFSAAELAKAGFTPAELRQAGFTARELLDAGFTPAQLLDAGYSPAEILAAENELPPGVSAEAVKAAGCDVETLKKERQSGVSAVMIRRYAGCSAAVLKAAGFSDEELARAGFTPEQIKAAASAAVKETDVENDQKLVEEIRAAGCAEDKLKQLLAKGVSAKQIRELNGCSAAQLKQAGYTVKDLSDAGLTPAELLAAGFSPEDLSRAGLNPVAALAAARVSDCSPSALRAAYLSGVSAATIRTTLGCSAKALKEAGYSAKDLKAAGFTAAELKNAGFSAAELKAAGFSANALREAGFSAKDLKDAGFSAADLKAAGFSAEELKNAGFSAAELKAAGFSAEELKAAGFSAADLKAAGFSLADLKKAGFSAAELKAAGFSPTDLKNAGFSAEEITSAGYSEAALQAAGLLSPFTSVAGLDARQLGAQGSTLPAYGGGRTAGGVSSEGKAAMQQLQAIVNRQNQEMETQQYKQAIQEKTGSMLGAANQLQQTWKAVSTQTYVLGQTDSLKEQNNPAESMVGMPGGPRLGQPQVTGRHDTDHIDIKAGDIIFAVLDTTVNSDEPSPILATIVSGRLKGSKLIGSFTFPPNAEKMVIMFNSLSVPGAPRTQTISAYAIDPETGRTALSGRVDHHYLSRYGSLFASTFIEGFGNAFQSANTSVTIGGTGGGDNITVQNGINRSALENAVIGLATVGKSWGQFAQQNVNRPTTIEVYSGTGVGVLFVQDTSVTE